MKKTENLLQEQKVGHWAYLKSCVSWLQDTGRQLKDVLVAERCQWILWTPVALGLGIEGYRLLPYEPPAHYGWIGWTVALCVLLFGKRKVRALGMIAFIIFLGFVRVQWVMLAANPPLLSQSIPVLSFVGTVVNIEHRPRLETMNYRIVVQVDQKDREESKLPKRVRLTVGSVMFPMKEGTKIRASTELHPLPGPVAPVGYDARFQGFCQGIGAVARPLSLTLLESPKQNWALKVSNLRHHLTRTFYANLEHPYGALAAALITGDRWGLPSSMRQDFANSGLAHLLAISGLHVSMVAGLIIALCRWMLSHIPWIALRWSVPKIAACMGIMAAGGYLMISGMGVPAQRAFIMATVTMLAVVMNHKVMTLRTLSFAATLILLSDPTALWGPSFQLSFAAVAGLILSGQWLKWMGLWSSPYRSSPGWKLRCWRSGVSMISASTMATLMTLPYTLMTFQRISVVGIVANLIAIPYTTLTVMPVLVGISVGAALGVSSSWAWKGLQTLLWMLHHFAHLVSQWPLSCVYVTGVSATSICIVTLGWLWFLLWQQSWRWWGLWGVALGILVGLWGRVGLRATLLVAHEGQVVGVIDEARKTLWFWCDGSCKGAVRTWKSLVGVTSVKKIPWGRSQELWQCQRYVCFAKDLGGILIARKGDISRDSLFQEAKIACIKGMGLFQGQKQITPMKEVESLDYLQVSLKFSGNHELIKYPAKMRPWERPAGP